MIRIYGKDNCAPCAKAKAFLDNRSINYEYLNIPRDISREDVLQKFPAVRVVPIVLYNEEYIGSYDDLVRWIENDRLDLATEGGST